MENPIEVLKTFLSIPGWHSERFFEIPKKQVLRIYRENPAKCYYVGTPQFHEFIQ